MVRRVVLHVGTMKSGTSFLQTLLFEQKAHLAEAGVLVPGAAWGAQASAVRAILGPPRGRGAWDSLTEEIAEHHGDAVVSMEFLGPINDKAADRVLSSFKGMEVQVVVTARDLNRTLVSMWQETIQNGRSWTWEEYLAGARETAPGGRRGSQDKVTAGGTFWRQQHLSRILGDWAGRVGAGNVTLVTVPRPGAAPSTLTDRFARATGLPLDPHLPVARANESLGLASTLVLRDLNAGLAERGFDGGDGQGLRKRMIAKRSLAALAADEPRLGLPVEEWVRRQTDATINRIVALGVGVVGDLADLDPIEVPGVGVEDVSTEDRLRAATVALVEAVSRHPGVRGDRAKRNESASERRRRRAEEA
ncbi:MAG: hypothetical protein FWE71_01220 [Nocardioidaceae bacterium]|nr:hypothetical protein [Nocardioidaceae bacterium]